MDTDANVNWPDFVGQIVDGETRFSASSLGVIIDALTARTDYLKAMMPSTGTSGGFTFYDTGFSPDCKVGMIVAQDPATGVYIPALGQGTGTYRDDGTEIPAASSKVIGIIISTDSEGSGATVLCYGCTKDPKVISSIVEEASNKSATSVSLATGDYYLSDEVPGAVYSGTHAKHNMSPYCFTCLYSGDSPTIFVRPQPTAYNGTPEIRKVFVGPDSTILSAVTNKGEVELSLSDTEIATDESTGKAVSSFTGSGVTTSPVVNKISGGVGTSVTQLSPGCFSVSSDLGLHSTLDLNLCALDGVYLGTSAANAVIYTFPKGVDASLTGAIRVPYIDDSLKVSADVSVCVLGNGSVTDMEAMYVTVQHVGTDDGAPIAVPVEYAIQDIATTDTSKVYEINVKLSESQKLMSNDLVYIKLKSSKPSVTTKVLSVSLNLNEVGNE